MKKRKAVIYKLSQGHQSEAFLPTEDRKFLATLQRKLDESKAVEGVASIRSRLSQPLPEDLRARTALLGALACRLVDSASDAGDEKAAEEGLALFRAHEEALRKYLEPTLYLYNVANALHTIANFTRARSNSYTLAGIEHLTEAKDHYWRGLKALPVNHHWPELMINLGNALDECSRTSEALYWYDAAIHVAPNHPMAHGNRAQSLVWLKTLTDQTSINAIGQIHQGLSRALGSHEVQISPVQRELWKEYLRNSERFLNAEGYTDIGLLYENIRREQVGPHTQYQRFCLANGIVLSEHSIYCQCTHVTHDGITIPKSSAPIAGAFVPKMELLLNRLKSEFALARCLLYQSYPAKTRRWNTEPFESAFTDLLDHEAIGIKAEMLRTSFRLCFGTLDRVAHGICELLDLADPAEKIYFHSFWRRPGGGSAKQQERWGRLNTECTPSLVALYSQATDLNIKKGQWGHLKGWRDKLEHELLFLVRDGADLGPLQEMLGFRKPLQLAVSDFRSATLQLLRFTAAAIINFALFVRQRALALPTHSGRAFTFRDRKQSQGGKRAE